MISNENKQFLKETLGPKWEEAVKQTQWWADFKHADSLGWGFKYGAHLGVKHYVATRDTSTGWVPVFLDLLIEVMRICAKEQAEYPVIPRLRLKGWKCKATQWSHLTQAYCYQVDGRVEPLYVNAEAAWAALARSQA